jgi:hypothetical protein
MLILSIQQNNYFFQIYYPEDFPHLFFQHL